MDNDDNPRGAAPPQSFSFKMLYKYVLPIMGICVLALKMSYQTDDKALPTNGAL